MGEGEGEGRGKKAFLFFFSLPLCRSVSRVLPVAREGGEAGRASERARWMDGSLPADALRFGPLPLPPRRLPAARPRAQVGQAVMDTREKWAPTQNEFKKSHKRTDGRTDGRPAGCVSDLVFRSLSPSLLPSLRPDRMSV